MYFESLSSIFDVTLKKLIYNTHFVPDDQLVCGIHNHRP